MRLFILCPVPIAAGIILFITMPLSTRNSFMNKLSISMPICFALATAESRSFLIGSPARFAKKSSWATASATLLPLINPATKRTFLGDCL